MNINTGEIVQLTDEQRAKAFASGHRLVPIEESQMTDAQRANLRVSLNDNRSTLGKLLHQQRSKYLPHVGKKQQAKALR